MTAGATFWLFQLLNALQYSMMLFLLASGLTIIFSLMRFVNLAHGSLYTLGALGGHSVVAAGGSFWLAFLLSPLLVAATGFLICRGLVRHPGDQDPMRQVLLSFGLVFILLDLSRMIWGDFPLGAGPPPLLAGHILAGGQPYPLYRLFLILLGPLVLGLLWVLAERTRLGLYLRAGADNPRMLACLGADVKTLFLWGFCLGTGLAGLAGVAAIPVFSLYPGMGIELLVPALVVVVTGGPGNVGGAFASALLVGSLETLGEILLPGAAGLPVYLLLTAVLLWRPRGLFPSRQHRDS